MNLDNALQQLSEDPSAPLDIAEVCLLLARDEYPHLDVEGYLSELDAMANEVRSYMGAGLKGQLDGLRRYLFHELGFHGNAKDYYDPQNSYLNMVLEKRIGIPISLSAVVTAVARRAGMEIEGIGLPGHFVVRARHGPDEILFDPFHGGRPLELRDCEQLVRRVTGIPFKATRESLEPLPLGFIVQRMLHNLKAIYLEKCDFRRSARVIDRLQMLDPDNPVHHRDLGVCFLNQQQSGKATDHLRAYLAAVPDADDAAEVRQMLQQAARNIAQWN